MADFSHLMATMGSIKGVPKVAANGDVVKKKKKKKSIVKTNDTATPAPTKTPPNTINGVPPPKKKKKKKSVTGPKPDSPTVKAEVSKSGLNSRGPVIDTTTKIKKKKAKAVLQIHEDKEREKKSKIWQALNPQSLYQKTEEEKAQDAEDVEFISVRGGSGIGVMEMEDNQYERDEFGNLILEEEEINGFEEEDVDITELADFDPETKRIMQENRAARDKEATERREVLRRNSMKERQTKEEASAKIIAEIEKKEAKLNKKKEISNKMVSDAQKRLEEELSFDYGFK